MTTNRQSTTYIRALVPPILILVLALIALEVAVRRNVIAPYLLPRPSAIIQDTFKNISSLSNDALITAMESLVGFILATIGAFVLAFAFAFSRAFDRSVFPLVVAFKCMPLVALAPILALWSGGGSLVAKALLAGFICFFPVIVNLRTGLNTIDQEAIDLFRSLSASRWVVLWKLRLPSAIPYFLSGLKAASTLAVIGAVVGEFACSDRGLGYQITEASYQGNTVRMFTAVTLLMCLGLSFFGLLSIIEFGMRRVFRVEFGNNNTI